MNTKTGKITMMVFDEKSVSKLLVSMAEWMDKHGYPIYDVVVDTSRDKLGDYYARVYYLDPK